MRWTQDCCSVVFYRIEFFFFLRRRTARALAVIMTTADIKRRWKWNAVLPLETALWCQKLMSSYGYSWARTKISDLFHFFLLLLFPPISVAGMSTFRREECDQHSLSFALLVEQLSLHTSLLQNIRVFYFLRPRYFEYFANCPHFKCF